MSLRTIVLPLILATGTASHAATLLLEDFEDSTVTYTSSVSDDLSDIANRDYFGRIAPDTSALPSDVSFGNIQGNGFYAAQDTDGANSGNIDLITLDWTNIDISSYENLNLSWFVAEDTASDGDEDWDTTTSLQITVQIDGGGFIDVFAVESELIPPSDQTNNAPRVDTNFDGIGDGVLITDQFSRFSSILTSGSTLDIRVSFRDLDFSDEDIAFDQLRLEGDLIGAPAIPEPSNLMVLTLLLATGLLSRKR